MDLAVLLDKGTTMIIFDTANTQPSSSNKTCILIWKMLEITKYFREH